MNSCVVDISHLPSTQIVKPYDELTHHQARVIQERLASYLTLTESQQSYLKSLEDKSISCIRGDVNYFADRLKEAQNSRAQDRITGVLVTTVTIMCLSLAVFGATKMLKDRSFILLSVFSFFCSLIASGSGYSYFTNIANGDEHRDGYLEIPIERTALDAVCLGYCLAPYVAFNRETVIQGALDKSKEAFNARMKAAIAFYESADQPLRQALAVFVADALQRADIRDHQLQISFSQNSKQTKQESLSYKFEVQELSLDEKQIAKILKKLDKTLYSILQNLNLWKQGYAEQILTCSM